VKYPEREEHLPDGLVPPEEPAVVVIELRGRVEDVVVVEEREARMFGTITAETGERKGWQR
jgi:hypothetical protein